MDAADHLLKLDYKWKYLPKDAQQAPPQAASFPSNKITSYQR
jgi:hypothetical protein